MTTTVPAVRSFSEGAAVVELRSAGDSWRLHVDLTACETTGQHMAAAQALKVAAEELLRLNRPRTSTGADDAISDEVRVLIAERGWTYAETAHEVGITTGRLSALVNGYSHWQLDDIVRVGRAFNPDDGPDRLAGLGIRATESAGR